MHSQSKPPVLLGIIVCAALFVPATAYAGNGKFRDGKFDFCVSVRFNATPAQLQRIREVFESANTVLHDATDGVHQMGTITIVNNSGASEAADFWIKAGQGIAYAPDGINFGVWGQHVMMFYDSNFGNTSAGDGLAYTVVHEFAHFAYDLGDEYSGPALLNLFKKTAECAAPGSDTETLNFCIMDNYWIRGARKPSFSGNFSLNEFCSQGNHDQAAPGNSASANNTYQHYEHGMSCWETISVNPKWPIPAKNPPQESGGFGLATPTQQAGSPDRRFMLLLDRSGSMSLDSKMTFARAAANAFLLDVPDSTQVGIASFADGGIINFFLSPITESNRQQAINTLFNIFPGGDTNIGHGLQIALAELEAQTDACCTQAIILISDGDHNVGTPPSAVINALVEAGVAVFTLGVGSGISASGEFTLQDLARQTGGKYYRVASAFNLGPAIESILFSEAIGSGPSRRSPLAVTTGQVTEVPVPVEQGATRAAFVVNKANSGDNISLSLRTPSGQTINPIDGSGGNPNIRHRTAAFTHRFYISSPEPGTWTMIITANSVSNGNLNVAGLIEHEGTKLSSSVKNELATYPQPFRITASPMWEGERVVGATVIGNVIHPQGISVPITLYDDGRIEHGDAVPGDGIYSENFNYAQHFGQHYRSGVPIAGTYTIELTTTNTNGTKYQGEVELFPDTPPPPSSVPAFTRLVSTTAIVTNVPQDTTAPSCQPTSCSSGSPASCDLTVQDTGVGLSLINVISTNNVNVNIPAFTAGTTSPVIVTGTLISPSSNGSFEIQSIDVRGNVSSCSRTVQASAAPKILFRTNRNGTYNYELYVMNADGSNQTRITNTNPPTFGNYKPTWSPNGQKVAFAAEQDGTSSWDIIIMNLDGTNRLNLTQHNAFESYFGFSPDGSKIVFESQRDGPFALWLINTDGTGLTRLLNNGGPEQPPAWSPNGQKIAFLSYINSVNNKTDIWVMNANGTNPTNLTQSAEQESRPRWSPDGTKILFARRASSSSPYDLYVMNADGSGLQRLTTNSFSADFRWSPDGTKIAFESNRDGDFEIYVMNADGSNQTRLTNSAGWDITPTWSSDGSRILFTSFRTGNSEVFIMNANGTGQVNLTNNAAIDDTAQWQP